MGKVSKNITVDPRREKEKENYIKNISLEHRRGEYKKKKNYEIIITSIIIFVCVVYCSFVFFGIMFLLVYSGAGVIESLFISSYNSITAFFIVSILFMKLLDLKIKKLKETYGIEE